MSARALRRAVEYALAGAAALPLALSPEPVARALGSAAGWLAGSVLRIRRRDVDAHLSLAFPGASGAWRRSVAGASYRHFGREAAVLVRLSVRGPDLLRGRVTVTGLEELCAALAEERGAVVVTGHLGDWEVGAQVLTALGAPVHAVAKPMANPRVDAHLTRLRERMGLRLVEPAEAPGEIGRRLAEGGLAVFVADQDAHERGVFVPFFGRRAATPRGPALLALRARAPLFLGTVVSDPERRGRYQARLVRIDPQRTGRLEADVRRLTEAYTAALEAEIRAHPEQYFWQHRRWKTRPEDDLQEQPSEAPV